MLSTYCRAYYTLKILRIARCTICSGSTMLNAMDCPLYSRAHSSPQKVFTESNVTSNRRRPDVTKKQYVVLILVPAFRRPHIRVILVIRSDWFFYVLKRSFALVPPTYPFSILVRISGLMVVFIPSYALVQAPNRIVQCLDPLCIWQYMDKISVGVQREKLFIITLKTIHDSWHI